MKMKFWFPALLTVFAASGAASQSSAGDASEFALVNASVSAGGKLELKASAKSSVHDFDFLVGRWQLHNRKLKGRLVHSTEWTEFDSTVEMRPLLNGRGNIDTYEEQRADGPYSGIAVRLFDPRTRLWSIYWADSVAGAFDAPMVGSFEGDVGWFYAQDTFGGQPILVAFKWDKTNPQEPVWSQAFSTDHGATWEMNSTNVSRRAR